MSPHTTDRRRPARAQPRRSVHSRVHGDVPAARESAFAAVYALVRLIPRGRVMTYGQIAAALGYLLSPCAIGWAMHGCPDDVPWHRVVNASGGCSTDRRGDLPVGMQRALLEAEKVRFSLDGTLDLARYRFEPPLAGATTSPRARRTR
jgi:methylated-DNA-protein-cysteine methyltransferase related protein